MSTTDAPTSSWNEAQIPAAKIIATLGPASHDTHTISRMAEAGMSVARLNFSHGSLEDHAIILSNIRNAAETLNRPIAVLQDLPGPKVRTVLETPLTLTEQEEVVLTTHGQTPAPPASIVIPVYNLPTLSFLAEGHRILIDDGAVVLKCLSAKGHQAHAVVVRGGTVTSRRGVVFPDSRLPLKGLSTQDKRYLEWGIAHEVDAVALSFVQDASDITAVRRLLPAHHAPLLIAKIETATALSDLSAIAAITDGVMVARGDLALAIGEEEVPFAQKHIVHQARLCGSYAIVATQMLESMVAHPYPTRAEVADVAHAILDGADAVMLSQETAVGQYPVEAVATMARVALHAQQHLPSVLPLASEVAADPSTPDAIAWEAPHLASRLRARAIVVFTERGTTARIVSRQVGTIPTIVMSKSLATLRQTLIGRQLFPVPPVSYDSQETVFALARRAALTMGVAQSGDRIVVVCGRILGTPGHTDTITVLRV